MRGLLSSIGGLLAVLNEHRQIVALNDALLDALGIEDAAAAFGLRPGEALGCVFAGEEPAGCGTSRSCSTCGAAIAIVTSLAADAPVERQCAMSVIRHGVPADAAFLVRAVPIWVQGQRFVLLFLRDTSDEQERAALERTFLHDISNMLTGLLGASELLAQGDTAPDLIDSIYRASRRLADEVEIQRSLLHTASRVLRPNWTQVSAHAVMEELRSFYVHHTAARDRIIEIRNPDPGLRCRTDSSIVLRVLCNMVTNALEATGAGGIVRIWVEEHPAHLVFCVWNAEAIPRTVARRIFQRNFSTRDGMGRGIGTYSMKRLGEAVLGGRVGFTSSLTEGTVFSIKLPR